MKQLFDAKWWGSCDGSLIEWVSKAPQLQKKKQLNPVWPKRNYYIIKQGGNLNFS